jgi:RNA polymerase sigma-70 factor (ECF subfamily)
MLALVERYEGRVFGLCYRMLGQREDAEDMTQETFTRALRFLHQWDSQRAFEPWLLAIAGNRCRTQLARRQRRPVNCTLVEPVPDGRPDSQAAENLAEEVQLALKSLREEYRQVFVLFHEHEMSYEEIGRSLDCPLGTVKTWVHRARKELILFLRKREVLAEPNHEVRSV